MDINIINCEITCKIIQMNLSSSMLGVSVTDTQHRHAHHTSVTSLLHHSWQLTNSRPAVGSVISSWDSGTGDRGVTYRRQIGDTVNNVVAWKMPSCICSCQLCIKSEVCCGTVGCCGNGWKLRWVAGKASNMTENALSILIVFSSVQLQQTEIWERKLFIFHHGSLIFL